MQSFFLPNRLAVAGFHSCSDRASSYLSFVDKNKYKNELFFDLFGYI